MAYCFMCCACIVPFTIVLMVSVDISSEQVDSSITAQVGWLGQKVVGHLALFYIHQMNRVNSCNDILVTTAP